MRWWQSILMLLVVLDLAIMPATADEHETGEDKYHASVDNAMDAYNAAIKRAFDKHLRTLTDLQTKQAKKGNRYGSEKLSDKILVLKREGPPLIAETKIRRLQSLMPRLKGNWSYCQLLCYENVSKRRIPAEFRLGRNVLRRRASSFRGCVSGSISSRQIEPA